MTLGQPLQMDILVKSWFRTALLISAESPSVQMRKSVGERGRGGYLSPQVGMIFPHAVPLIRIE